MFTGIVEELGKVVENERQTLRVETGLPGFKRGDSVAVNGVCLTVAELDSAKRGRHSLALQMSIETVSRTCLALARAGDEVNLERPLTLSAFVGGHLVTGHVDASVPILSKKKLSDGSVALRVELPRGLAPFIVVKGSMAVDGVSLTVTKTGRFWTESVLIPHTLAHTTLGRKDERDLVNLEVDILARYVSHLMGNGR